MTWYQRILMHVGGMATLLLVLTALCWWLGAAVDNEAQGAVAWFWMVGCLTIPLVYVICVAFVYASKLF